jgi:hypothetical protein
MSMNLGFRTLVASHEVLPAKVFKDGLGEIGGDAWISDAAWYAALARGEVDGQFRIGRQFFVACAPWRERFGIDAMNSGEQVAA